MTIEAEGFFALSVTVVVILYLGALWFAAWLVNYSRGENKISSVK
jgi:hypothetical protein